MTDIINKELENDIYLTAIKKWGKEMQFNLLIEECSEVIKEVIKQKRGFENKDSLCEEIADVEIMIGQIKTFWGNRINSIKQRKLIRLSEKLNIDINDPTP